MFLQMIHIPNIGTIDRMIIIYLCIYLIYQYHFLFFIRKMFSNFENRYINYFNVRCYLRLHSGCTSLHVALILSRERRAGLRPRTETLRCTCYSQVYASASFIRARSRCISLPLVLLYAPNERHTREARRCSKSAINRSRTLDNPNLINLIISLVAVIPVRMIAIIGDMVDTISKIRKYSNTYREN